MDWRIADAKNRFSELFTQVLTVGPQRVRRSETLSSSSLNKTTNGSRTGHEPTSKDHLTQGEPFDGLDLTRNSSSGQGSMSMRVLLDTCALAELHHPLGHPAVKANDRSDCQLMTCFSGAIGVGEIARGVALLADGRKKRS